MRRLWGRCVATDEFHLYRITSLTSLATRHSVAIVAPAHSYRASVYLRAAAQHSISVVFVSDSNTNVVPSLIDGLRVEFEDLVAAKKTICDLLSTYRVQAVIAPDETHVAFAAAISAQLGLPHNSVDALKTVADKHLARQQLREHGIDAIPGFTLVDLDRDLDEQLSDVGYPCVAKPVNMTASRGVIRADRLDELKDAFKVIQHLLVTEFGQDRFSKVIVEDYIDGSEHALEGYLSGRDLEVICLFDKPDPLHGPYFEETYYITPSRLDESTQEQIRQTILTACGAHGLTMGPIHAEVRLYQGKVWIIEIAARSIGGDCGRLFELTTRSSIEEYVLCRLVGQSTDHLELESAAGVLMIPVTEQGILRRVEGVTDAQSVDHILEVQMDVRSGEKLTGWPVGGKYPGYIYALADTPQEAESALRTSYSHLKFVCMPDLPVVVQ